MNKQKVILGAVGVFCVGLIIMSVYFYSQWKKATTTAVDNTAETLEVVTQVEQHLKLPEGETPTLATVTDREKLQTQEFFKNAENGDKVLIYSAASKAILYRPSIDRIIEVAPVFFNDASTTNSGS